MYVSYTFMRLLRGRGSGGGGGSEAENFKLHITRDTIESNFYKVWGGGGGGGV